MLDHMTFRVAQLDRTEVFYTAALAPLGYSLDQKFAVDDQRMIGYSAINDQGRVATDTWFVEGTSPHGGPRVTTGAHLCWQAPSRAAVDAFYDAAMKHGGKDNGPPALRDHYHEHYYGAFVIDPDGNNIEACCHDP
jgi:catechol 2,3-dioxygenase-like lactoylglutathione lyase family enzyme